VTVGQQRDQGPLHQAVLPNYSLTYLGVEDLDETSLFFYQVIDLAKAC
jgi:hypothetical protein